ncbi:MAG: hypothetical protein WC459_00655 [Patescibacteria group bacterium]
MKTIFISVSRGLTARNILRSDVLKSLKNGNIKIVLLVLDKAIEEIRKEFEDRDVELIAIKQPKMGRLRVIYLKIMSRALVWTESSRMVLLGGQMGLKKKNFFYSLTVRAIVFLSSSKLAKKLFLWAEFHIFKEGHFDYIFKERKADLFFSADIHSNIDTLLLKSAKRFGVKTVGMPKGWDALGQRLLRVMPDKFVLQNNTLKKDTMEFQDIEESRILVSGFPSFDFYWKKDLLWEREEFCNKTKLDPKKPILFFGSSGLWSKDDCGLVEFLYDCIKKEKFIKPCSLIVRPHFSNIKYNPYKKFYGESDIYIDDKYTTSNFLDNWNPTPSDIRFFVNSLFHSNVILSYASTLSMDACAINRPIINLYFGGQFDDFGADRTELHYQFSHYKVITKNPAVKKAGTGEELIKLINQYLENPELDSALRLAMRRDLCSSEDGLAGERIAKFLIQELDS